MKVKYKNERARSIDSLVGGELGQKTKARKRSEISKERSKVEMGLKSTQRDFFRALGGFIYSGLKAPDHRIQR